jgi:hypothetical protein
MMEHVGTETVHHHEPKSFWTKYIFSQDHKIIGIQYLVTAFPHGLSGYGFVLADEVATGLEREAVFLGWVS